MRLQTSEVEEILVKLHSVNAAGRPALQARVRKLRQLNYPPGLTTGRGNPTQYSAGDLFRVVLAFEFFEFGMTPQRVIITSGRFVRGIRRAAGEIGAALESGVFETDYKKQIFFRFEPVSLESLGEYQAVAPVDDKYLLSQSWAYGADEARDTIETRRAIINVTILLQRTASYLNELNIGTAQAFGSGLVCFANEQGWEAE